MTRSDEDYLFNSLDQIRYETHENNLMLRDICKVINVYLANHNQENEDDFGRNVLANLLSNMVELNGLGRFR